MSINDLIETNKDLSDVEPILYVKNWMTPEPLCIKSEQSIQEAGEWMISHKLDTLPIVDDDHHFLGTITLRQVLSYFLHNSRDVKVGRDLFKRNFAVVHPEDSILEVFSLPYNELPVLDSEGKLIGLLSKGDITDGFSKYISKLKQKQHTAEALNTVLESAYEGIAVVDENGTIQEFNEAYSRFTGIEKENAIGRHVTEVIDNTELHMTVKTGLAERGVLQTIQGHEMVVHRIPIVKNGAVIGAIGMLIFEGISEIYKIYERLKETDAEEPERGTKQVGKKKENHITLDQIIGVSEEIKATKRLARRAARTAATVLITGESGTGKEMFAKSIHHLSPFATGPMISVNCAAIPEHLFESELFGYEEGAFSGAKKGGKPGKFELANNGTIFLDEIAELPLSMQTKLLRVLQEKEAERVGGVKKYQTNVRVIAATNQHLKELVEKGTFREDLFYRLNIIRLHVPALRERKQDIPILLSYYAKEICEKYRVQTKRFTHEALSTLTHSEWKGNIRELVNTIERVVTLIDEPVIGKDHLNGLFRVKEDSEKHIPDEKTLSLLEEAKRVGKDREKETIVQAIKDAGGNKTKAAERLGIHRTTLYQKLKSLDIS
ncbi:sigma-54-dependent Fis family transcriptional regulator [Bacillus sp. Cs-700]|uniref:sigma-54-dependent Fis family transcriptional regulator n=1 Tax=Bacillus sp. Cs-700 TaxID=2589818 RepID=UPI00140C5CEB|nr:sigma-54-dependent Fis family transcriptional regulator [Bacillus sp. Cs-700]